MWYTNVIPIDRTMNQPPIVLNIYVVYIYISYLRRCAPRKRGPKRIDWLRQFPTRGTALPWVYRIKHQRPGADFESSRINHSRNSVAAGKGQRSAPQKLTISVHDCWQTPIRWGAIELVKSIPGVWKVVRPTNFGALRVCMYCTTGGLVE